MGVLWEFYRVRYPLACWISIVLAIHSLDQSLLIRLILQKAGARKISYRGRCSLR